MHKQALGIAVYPDLVKIAPGALEGIDAQFGFENKPEKEFKALPPKQPKPDL